MKDWRLPRCVLAIVAVLLLCPGLRGEAPSEASAPAGNATGESGARLRLDKQGVKEAAAPESGGPGGSEASREVREPAVERPVLTQRPLARELSRSGETLPASEQSGMVRALLVGGGSSHDFEGLFRRMDSTALKESGKVIPAYTSNWQEALELMPNADVLVLSANHPSFGSPEFQKALNAFADAGHGLVMLHAGVWRNWAPASGFNTRFVGGGARSHGRGEFSVFSRKPDHPVMEGVPEEFRITDEHYHVILDAGTPVEMLAETGPETSTLLNYPSVWEVKDPKTRIVCIALGHGVEAHSSEVFQRLLLNAVRWVGGK